jgi:hypothetical protein
VTHFCIFSSRAWAWIPYEKRKALDPQSTKHIFVGYPDGMKRYRLIDISLDQINIERSVQFEESFSHVPQQLHADTFILPPILYYEHAHAKSSSDKSYDSKDSDDSDLESIQSYAELEHPDAVVEPEHPDAVAELEHRPKLAQTTL